MKKILRFYEDDFRDMIMEKYDLRPEQLTSVYTEECVGYGEGERMEPVFYIEVEEDG